MQLIREPQALYLPHGCIICGSAKFPILDLARKVTPYQIHLYLCRIHAKEIAQAFGFAEGDELDSLMQVRDELAAKLQEHNDLQVRFENLRHDLVQVGALYEQQTAELNGERQQNEQLRAHLEHVRNASEVTFAAVANGHVDEEPEDVADVQ